MKNCLARILDSLKTYTSLGDFVQFIVQPDGSSQAIYQHGTVDYDSDGKIKEHTPLKGLRK